MAKSDLLVMNEIASKNGDIRMSPYFVSAQLAKGGGHVTMGVDEKVIHDLMDDGKYILALYVVNREEFEKIKNQTGDGQ